MHRRNVLIGLVAVVAIAAVLSWLFLRPEPPREAPQAQQQAETTTQQQTPQQPQAPQQPGTQAQQPPETQPQQQPETQAEQETQTQQQPETQAQQQTPQPPEAAPPQVQADASQGQRLPAYDQLTAEMVLGDTNAPVTIIAYESLTCPHCAAFDAETLPKLKAEYIDTGKVKLVMRGFPFDQLALAGEAMARCAGKSRYFGLISVLFRTQQSWAAPPNQMEKLQQIGRLSGLSKEDFDACMADKDLQKFIVGRLEEANKKYGVSSTPTFIINEDKKIVGAQPYEEFEKVLKPLIN